jgi:hypothetical protein
MRRKFRKSEAFCRVKRSESLGQQWMLSFDKHKYEIANPHEDRESVKLENPAQTRQLNQAGSELSLTENPPCATVHRHRFNRLMID